LGVLHNAYTKLDESQGFKALLQEFQFYIISKWKKKTEVAVKLLVKSVELFMTRKI
jgi:hypothetical protein